MIKRVAVLATVLALFCVMFIGCKAANKVPGVSAVHSAVSSAIASAVPSLPPSTSRTVVPTATATIMATATAK